MSRGPLARSALILTASMLMLCIFSATVPGTATAAVEGDYTYTVLGDQATITGYTGVGGAILIPSTLGGKTVEIIGDSAFIGKSSLTSVVLPNSLISLNHMAFYGCNALTSMDLGSGLISIGSYAFAMSGLTSLT
ncbi:MAG: leucine-rich repeat domain-containing protein, partial [Methanomassiliicoccales archaeon]